MTTMTVSREAMADLAASPVFRALARSLCHETELRGAALTHTYILVFVNLKINSVYLIHAQSLHFILSFFQEIVYDGLQ